MIKEIPSAIARKNFGDLLNEVKYGHDSVVITKAGKPVAALVEIEIFEKIRKLKAEFEAMTAELRCVYQDVEFVEAETEINEALKHARKRQG